MFQIKALEDAVESYYSTLTQDEHEEQMAWGEFALSQWSDSAGQQVEPPNS